MQNTSILKNELIFHYAAGNANLSESLMASTYLFLNSRESKLYSSFENYCGNELANAEKIQPKTLTYNKCMVANLEASKENTNENTNPLNRFVNNYKDLKWKKIFSGFYEYSFKLSQKENAKIIKMDPNTSIPLHSHNGKEYILVLEGSFSDEYGCYSKGDLQINDSKIKHTPISNKNNGCICLIINNDDLVFYGTFAPILNLFTFIKSIFTNYK